MDEPWKKLVLSVERPYKDEHGNPIPILYDINEHGQHFYERKQTPAEILAQNLKRVFAERGLDFFDKTKNGNLADIVSKTVVEAKDSEDEAQTEKSDMTTEEMREMCIKIAESLGVAQGELSEAGALLDAILPSSAPTYNPATAHLQQLIAQQPPSEVKPALLTATTVKPLPPPISIQAFNAQLVLGGKDESLRKAADIFKVAANKMDSDRFKSEKYWADALKIRRANWGLVPAPLPPGVATGKGADKSSRDFMVTYGLEESSQVFRRRAIGWMGTKGSSEDIVFPHRQNHSLRVCLVVNDGNGTTRTTYSTPRDASTDNLQSMLKTAQREMVDQEIFTFLVHEASNLPSASAKVSERLIAIDAALGTEVRFELIEGEDNNNTPPSSVHQATCDLIYHSLHALLLRRHASTKQQRLAGPSSAKSDPPLILQPIIDILQYQVFCDRVKTEIDGIVQALSLAGMLCTVRYQPIGQVGNELVKLLDDQHVKSVGGQCILRIDKRHSIRFSFLSPSTLTAHLSQATLTISSIPQLTQLISDDVGRFLLTRICELGREITEEVGGIWFLDLNRCVGRWEGCVFNFRIEFEGKTSIKCIAFRLDRQTSKDGEIDTFHNMSIPLLKWVEGKITTAIKPT